MILKKKITPKTKAIMCVHLLGLSSNMSEIVKIAKRKKLIVIEDTCESLGSKFKSRNLGNFGISELILLLFSSNNLRRRRNGCM